MRGQIKNIARKQQINDFSGLRYGNITATDMDGVIDYHDRKYIFFEVKYGNAELPYGQRLCIERLVCDIGKPSICIIAEHNVSDTNKPVDVGKCKVREIYLNTEKKWRPPKRSFLVRELCDAFLKEEF